MKTNLSRREFLAGVGATVGATGLAAASAGLVGCTSMNTGTAKTGAVSDKAQGAEGNRKRIPESYLNPQDYNYTSNSITDFSRTKLFSPWTFGPLKLNHRMVKSAAGSDTFVTKGFGEEMIAYYTNFAKGGVEMIWVEDFANLYSNFPSAYKTITGDDGSLHQLAKAIHNAGSYCGYQLSLMGAKFSNFDPAKAAQYESAHADNLSHKEIKQLQEDYIRAARLLKDQGYDAIEINAAGNNIGQAFLSRNRNARDDEYGPQSFENRTRFITEIIKGIKNACGQNFPVQVLINGIEENDITLGDNSKYTTVEENAEMAKQLEAAGANALHVRLGPAGMHVCQFASDLYFSGIGIEGSTGFGNQFDFSRHWQGKLIGNHSGCGMMLDVAREIKSAVSIPVGTVTYMDPAHAPDYFEQALKDGKIDFMLMTRPLTVDPDYIKKLRENRIDEIAPCTRCMHCHFDFDEKGKKYEHCRVNATTQRAYRADMPEGFNPLPANGSKNVMVIGGGPAGMEAARIAAERGYSVTLYEKNGYLGGLLLFANAVKGPHENLNILRAYLERQLELKGVKVVKGQEVNADFIAKQAPDVVILAAGGRRGTLGLTGTSATKVISIDKVMSVDVGENVAIVGGNVQAVDIALYLLAQGKNITIVSPDPIAQLEKGHSSWVKSFVKPMLFARGTRVWPKAKIVSVGDGKITVRGETGVDMTIACDTVIEAMDMLPNTDLINGLGAKAYAVGDCKTPWNIAKAIASGNLTARKI